MKINDIHNIAYYNKQIEFYSSNILAFKLVFLRYDIWKIIRLFSLSDNLYILINIVVDSLKRQLLKGKSQLIHWCYDRPIFP